MFKTKKKKKEEIEKLKAENNELQQNVLSLQGNREINYGLYNMVKAIMKQLNLNEIEIERYKLKEVERMEIYVEDSFMKNAKIIRLVDNKAKIYEVLKWLSYWEKKPKLIKVMVYKKITECSNYYLVHNLKTKERKVVKK